MPTSRAGQDFDNQLVEVGLARLAIIGVGNKFDKVAGLPVVKHPGAGADRFAVEFPAVERGGVAGGLRQDVGEETQVGCIDLGEVDHNRSVVRAIDGVYLGIAGCAGLRQL